MAAVAFAAAVLLGVAAASIIVPLSTRHRRDTAVATADCSRILRMIDDAYLDRRMSPAEAAAIEDASAAMRAAATPGTSETVARCVGGTYRRS